MTGNDISISLSEFLMKLSGYWLATTDGEQKRRTITKHYTYIILLFGIYVNVTDFCHSFGDIANLFYVFTNLLLNTIALLKTLLLHVNRKRFFQLVHYTRRNFWHSNYNDDEKVFMEAARKNVTFLVIITYVVMVYIVCTYVCVPLYENIGRNHSDRELPFRMWTNLPLTETPYFEICFTLQAMSALQIGICYVCVDNYLLLINSHTVSQFRILQFNLISLLDYNSELIKSAGYANNCYQGLRRHIRQHQALINYCDRIEIIFTFNIFCYVLVFSVLSCLSLYQALLGDISAGQRLSFIVYVGGSVFQLLMLTDSCGSLITESANVGAVAYELSWPALSMKRSGLTIRRDVCMIILRSQKPCQLTAGGFFPISLQTSTKLISSAMSYFTLLKQSSSNIQDT